jgi:oligoendopeptidase F
MRRRYKEDASYASQVDTFLSLGERKSVENIFKEIGIDMSKASTFNEGLDLLEQEIRTFEKLAKQLNMVQ